MILFADHMLTILQDLELHGCDGNVSIPRSRLGRNMLLTGLRQPRCIRQYWLQGMHRFTSILLMWVTADVSDLYRLRCH